MDILARAPDFWQWSLRQLEHASMWGPLVINDIVYAEISTRYPSLDAVDSTPLDFSVDLVPTPRAALFLAGEAYALSHGWRSCASRALAIVDQ